MYVCMYMILCYHAMGIFLCSSGIKGQSNQLKNGRFLLFIYYLFVNLAKVLLAIAIKKLFMYLFYVHFLCTFFMQMFY